MATREELEQELASCTNAARQASLKAMLQSGAEFDEEEAEVFESSPVMPEDVPDFDPDSPLEPIEQLADAEAEATRPEED